MNPGVPQVPAPRTVHRLSPDGQIRDWLVSPVWQAPCDDLGEIVRSEGHPWDEAARLGRWRLTNGPDVAPVKSLLYAAHPLLPPPTLPDLVEGGELSWPSALPASAGPHTGTWTRYHTADDGVIERSAFCYTPTYRTFLAATRLEVDQPEARVLEIRSTGPVQVWLGGHLALEDHRFGYMQPWTARIETLLASGTTDLLIVSWNVSLREVRQTVSGRVVGLPLRVVLPSPGADARRSIAAEQVLDSVGVRRWQTDGDTFELHGPVGARIRLSVNGIGVPPVCFDEDGFARVAIPRTEGDSSQASMLGTGELVVRIRVDDDGCPPTRDLLVGHLPWRTRQVPEGNPVTWRCELLEHVASRAGSASCLARAALTAGSDEVVVTLADIQTPLRLVGIRSDCADFEAVALMLLWHRVPARRWESTARTAVRDVLLGFKYWIDQPGIDAMCYFTENHQIVWHTAETLVGEAFSDERFTNTGWTGGVHAEHGRAMARSWIARKLRGGFSEFDSNAYLAIDALALVALVDHARDESLRRSAEALLDKILLTLASNSWRGVHGSAHGRAYTPALRAPGLEETAPIMWLAWGMGALNDAVLPAAALATSRAYVVPDVIRAIASDTERDWYGTQTYTGDYAFERDLLVRPYESRVVVRRGPGGMISSVQDYRYGLPGLQEHVWGITLPGQVQVWATNPAARGHGSHTRPGGWVGHRVLPRVRQHDRTVIALHRFCDPGDGTHLWFPTGLLDEWAERGDWLVGRRGDGFVGVASAGGWEPDRFGDQAWQRWVPRGSGDALVARLADSRQYADLAAFGADLPVLEFRRRGPGVRVGEPGSPQLELDWDATFLVDGAPADPADCADTAPPHLDNPACRSAATDDLLDVEWAGHSMRLDVVAGRRLRPASGIDADPAFPDMSRPT